MDYAASHLSIIGRADMQLGLFVSLNFSLVFLGTCVSDIASVAPFVRL